MAKRKKRTTKKKQPKRKTVRRHLRKRTTRKRSTTGKSISPKQKYIITGWSQEGKRKKYWYYTGYGFSDKKSNAKHYTKHADAVTEAYKIRPFLPSKIKAITVGVAR